MKSGVLPRDHLDHPQNRKKYLFDTIDLFPLIHSFKFQSSFLSCTGNEPIFTTKCKDFTGCLDYIFFTPNTIDCIDALEMPFGIDKSEAEKFDFIPNKDYPSDHLPLVARFKFPTASTAEEEESDDSSVEEEEET